MEKLEKVSFDIPSSLLAELQHLAKRDNQDFNTFWIKWMPRFRDMVRDWKLTEAFADDCIDSLRLGTEANR